MSFSLTPELYLGPEESDSRLLKTSDQDSYSLLSTLYLTGQGVEVKARPRPSEIRIQVFRLLLGPPALGLDPDNVVSEADPR